MLIENKKFTDLDHHKPSAQNSSVFLSYLLRSQDAAEKNCSFLRCFTIQQSGQRRPWRRPSVVTFQTDVSTGPSVFVDPKYPYSVELRQLGEEDTEQGAGVDEEMSGVIFCVETGKDIPAVSWEVHGGQLTEGVDLLMMT